ncbi:MAG TPA: hypothetical protein VLL52_18565 [Anaerolineae bacterium]|nr:hypothetical protein [Anaerolineae bacterium]
MPLSRKIITFIFAYIVGLIILPITGLFTSLIVHYPLSFFLSKFFLYLTVGPAIGLTVAYVTLGLIRMNGNTIKYPALIVVANLFGGLILLFLNERAASFFLSNDPITSSTIGMLIGGYLALANGLLIAILAITTEAKDDATLDKEDAWADFIAKQKQNNQT